MTPLRLTDEQLNQVMRTAAPIPPELRDEYLRRVADQLRGLEFGDGEVYRACRRAAKAVLWNMQRALEEQPQPRDREPNKLLTAPTAKGRRSIRRWRRAPIVSGRRSSVGRSSIGSI